MNRTLARYNRRRAVYKVFADYAEGVQTLRYSSRMFETRYGNALASALRGSLRVNMCPAVISGFTEAIAIESWGEQNDEVSDSLDFSRLEAGINQAAFRDGNAYVLVWPDARTERLAPRQINAIDLVPIVNDQSPMDPLDEVWHFGIDGDDNRIVDVYDREKRTRYVIEDPIMATVGLDTGEVDLDDQEFTYVRTDWYRDIGVPEGQVPIFWFKLDAPTPLSNGRSVLTDVIPLQDAANKALSDLIVLSERYAIPLVYVLNYVTDRGVPSNPYLSDGSFCGAPSESNTPLSETPSTESNEGASQNEPSYNPGVFGGLSLTDAGPAAWFQFGREGRKAAEANGFDPDRPQGGPG